MIQHEVATLRREVDALKRVCLSQSLQIATLTMFLGQKGIIDAAEASMVAVAGDGQDLSSDAAEKARERLRSLWAALGQKGDQKKVP